MAVSGRGKRCLILPLLALASLCGLRRGALSFVPQQSHGGAMRLGARTSGLKARGARPAVHASKQEELDTILFPPEMMWFVPKGQEGEVLQELFPGARSFQSIFWAIVQPAASAGYLIVAISSYLKQDIVDWNPITKEYLGFLKPGNTIKFLPQGIFMGFYGLFGSLIFGPIQWWMVAKNSGYGIAEFNKKSQRFTMVRDGELLQDIAFEDIQAVCLQYASAFVTGSREILLVLKSGEEIRFQNNLFDPPKRILERKASLLADFLDVDLEVVE